eukprot:gene7776-638_t
MFFHPSSNLAQCCVVSFIVLIAHIAVADECNVDREDCGFLNNRQCPDPTSGHPSHLTRCCDRNPQGCLTACCADYYAGTSTMIIVVTIFLSFCLCCPIFAFCCRQFARIRQYREHTLLVEDQLLRSERAFDEREHQLRGGVSEDLPSYYGPDEKAPEYDQALSHTVITEGIPYTDVTLTGQQSQSTERSSNNTQTITESSSENQLILPDYNTVTTMSRNEQP